MTALVVLAVEVFCSKSAELYSVRELCEKSACSFRHSLKKSLSIYPKRLAFACKFAMPISELEIDNQIL